MSFPLKKGGLWGLFLFQKEISHYVSTALRLRSGNCSTAAEMTYLINGQLNRYSTLIFNLKINTVSSFAAVFR